MEFPRENHAMAIVRCSACQQKLKVADTSLGKKVKCACGQVFVAEAEAVIADAIADKVIVACTECGSNLKVAPASLGKKMKCPKCAAVFIANIVPEAPPVIAAPVVATPVVLLPDDGDDLMAFAQADEDPPQPKQGNAPPPMMVEEGQPLPTSKGKSEPKRAVPAKADARKRYPSRILVNLFVFLLLSLFIGFFAVGYLMMEQESVIEPNTTNRKYLEGFGWPVKKSRTVAPRNDGPGNMPNKGLRKGKKRGNDDKDKIIAGEQENAVDGENRNRKDGLSISALIRARTLMHVYPCPFTMAFQDRLAQDNFPMTVLERRKRSQRREVAAIDVVVDRTEELLEGVGEAFVVSAGVVGVRPNRGVQ
jgi:predicted RNA-binding Zn-ribbon protein involved in translation (DUF1610 family)